MVFLNPEYHTPVKAALSPQSLRGGSDASYVTEAGIPCLDSMGTRGGKSHSINEFAHLDSLAVAAKRIAVIAMGI